MNQRSADLVDGEERVQPSDFAGPRSVVWRSGCWPKLPRLSSFRPHVLVTPNDGLYLDVYNHSNIQLSTSS